MSSKSFKFQVYIFSLCFLSYSLAKVDPLKAESIYEFTVKDTYGQDVSLEKFKGNVVIVVNIASNCGLAKSQYSKMMELRGKYHDKGLRIIALPSNQFIGQMPESNGDETMQHLKEHSVEFDLVMAKADVNGNSASPLFKYLKHQQGSILGSSIKWNFTKFLIDKNGRPVNRFAPITDPMDIAKHIDRIL